MPELDLARDRERVDLAADDPRDEALQPLDVLGQPPAIQPLLVDDRLAGQQRLGERFAPLAVVKQEHPAPFELDARQRVDDLGGRERLEGGRAWGSPRSRGARRSAWDRGRRS